MSATPPYRPGDIVRLQHTGEQWVVAYADPESGRLGWCGWPQGEALIANCTLVRAASDAESAAIRAALVGTGGQRSATVARLYPMGEPVVPDTWEWWAGPDDESLTIGPCPTREAAITQAASEGLAVAHVVETVQRPIDLGAAFSADVAIERMEEHLEEEHGDGNGDWLTHAITWTPEHRADLERRLTRTVRDWQVAHGIVLKPWQFSAQRNAERVEIPVPSSSPSPVPSSALPQVVSPSV